MVDTGLATFDPRILQKTPSLGLVGCQKPVVFCKPATQPLMTWLKCNGLITQPVGIKHAEEW